MRQPSCRHVWNRVIVHLDFCISKPAKQALVAFPVWTKSRAHIGCRMVITQWRLCTQIVLNDCTKSKGPITRLHAWPTMQLPLHNVNTGEKRPHSPLNFFGYSFEVITIFIYIRNYIICHVNLFFHTRIHLANITELSCHVFMYIQDAAHENKRTLQL